MLDRRVSAEHQVRLEMIVCYPLSRRGEDQNMRILFGILAILFGVSSAEAFDPKAKEKLIFSNHCEGCDLSGAALSKAHLEGAGLAGADLRQSNLHGAYLLGANLENANLRGADLSAAILDDARFKGADLTDAILDKARLGGADLSGAIGLTQAQLDGACKDSSGRPFKTKLPKGLTVRRCK